MRSSVFRSLALAISAPWDQTPCRAPRASTIPSNVRRILITVCAVALPLTWGPAGALADLAPVVTAPPSASIAEGETLSFTVSAMDPDGDAINSLTYDIHENIPVVVIPCGGDPDPCCVPPECPQLASPLAASNTAITTGVTFTVGVGNTSGTFTWTPGYLEAGSYGVIFTASNALSGSAETEFTITNATGPPVVTAPARAYGLENVELEFAVSASDPGGDAIDALTASGTAITAGGSFSAGWQNKSGAFSWTPGAGQAGSYGVTFTAVNALSGTATTAITVKAFNRAPHLDEIPDLAVAGGSTYDQILTGADPDGDALTFLMLVGPPFMAVATTDATHGSVHLAPGLAAAAGSPFSAAVAVTDGYAGATRSFQITVYRPLAVVLNPNTINLKSHAPWVTAYIEPSGFNPASIVLSSLRLAGSVPAVSKFAIVGDHDRNGSPDLMVKFSREALDPLLTIGVSKLEVTGSLVTGEQFKGSDEIRVISPSGGKPTASVAPNPLNPAGTLTFRTTRAGAATVRMFDLRGRLVRTLMAVPLLPAGNHELRIDGRTDGGQGLASGLYFYRVETSEGALTGRIAIMK